MRPKIRPRLLPERRHALLRGPAIVTDAIHPSDSCASRFAESSFVSCSGDSGSDAASQSGADQCLHSSIAPPDNWRAALCAGLRPADLIHFF